MLTIILDALDTDEERDKATELYNKHGDAKKKCLHFPVVIFAVGALLL